MTYAARLLLLAALAMVLGCQAAAPSVEVLGAAVTDRGPDGTRLGFEIEVVNPGDEPLQLLDVRYEVAVDGVDVYRGRHAAQVTVNRGDRRTLTVPAVVPDAAAGIARCTISGVLHYVLPGAINRTLRQAGLYRPTARFGRTVEPGTRETALR